MKRIRVTVTPEDIDRGVPQDPRACPLALALKRNFPAIADSVRVYPSDVSMGGVRSHESRAVGRFTSLFDGGRHAATHTFLLTFPSDPTHQFAFPAFPTGPAAPEGD